MSSSSRNTLIDQIDSFLESFKKWEKSGYNAKGFYQIHKKLLRAHDYAKEKFSNPEISKQLVAALQTLTTLTNLNRQYIIAATSGDDIDDFSKADEIRHLRDQRRNYLIEVLTLLPSVIS